MPQKWVIAANGDPTNEPPWGSTLKIETGAENIMPIPLAGGQEISFAPQMIFLGLRPGGWANNNCYIACRFGYIFLRTLPFSHKLYSQISMAIYS